MMNTQPQQPSQPLRRANWIFLCSLIPVVALGLAASCFVVSEVLAQRQVDAELANLRERGAPVDDASMTAWYQNHTRTEGCAAWNEAILASAGLGEIEADLPIVGSGKLPRDYCANTDWPDAPRVKQFLAYIDPLIKRIHEAAQYPTPVQQNLLFQGIATRLFELQHSRDLVRLLQLDCVYALHTQDAERALQDLTTMHKSAQAFESDLFLVGQLVHVAMLGLHLSEIDRSLQCDLWRPEHLTQLIAQVSQPVDVQKKWQIGLDGERAMMMAALFDSEARDLTAMADGTPSVMLSLNPSGKLRMLRVYRDLQNQSVTSWMESSTRPPELFGGRNLKSGTFATDASPFWLHMFLPAESAVVAAFQRVEQHRRLALTALSIKRYQQEHGKWPEDLHDLERTGLSINDWTVPGIGSFGYRVEEDQAKLWGADPDWLHADRRISSEPPIPRDDAEAFDLWWLVSIR